jgi:hypothetical protein
LCGPGCVVRAVAGARAGLPVEITGAPEKCAIAARGEAREGRKGFAGPYVGRSVNIRRAYSRSAA